MSNDVRGTIETARRLRLAGEPARALQLASQALQANAQDWAAMAEAIRILICLGEGQTATGLYQRLAAATDAGSLEPECLVRLALLLGRQDLLAEMEPPEGPSWLVKLLNDGVDPVTLLVVEDVQIRLETGHPIFVLNGSCPHCGHHLKQEFRNTLLVYRVWTCPSCFGSVAMDHITARAALADKYSHQLADGLQNVDRQLIERIKPRLLGQEPAPFIVSALGQGYQFLLNELVLKYGGTP